ncbi:probable myosin light chain kinase DDB_G0284661 [Dendronephthya gigantea]|uniref:probable myosin light chain kinase DDB_G0284661 n=1 Tax=Dendronephthya gigantea TaxID=151771 RepID=UPI00106DC2DD|nr:probable myosin light chain kinase DDB_G0284661 [Dendronephthya gigantea]
MASAFKIPNLVVKTKTTAILPTFDWNLFRKERKLGSGSFGSVYLGEYNEKEEKVVTKKVKVQSIDSKSRCKKEAALLNSIKGHKNIVQFLGFCEEPCSIMLEYISFSFSPLGAEKCVSTLADFLRLLDEDYDFESFSHLLPVCAQDIVAGLEYLHGKNIAHRDLKLGNILVSNQHYVEKFTNELDLSKAYVECLSRSHNMQTKTVLQSKTDSINRGTPSYMAPEIHLNKIFQASQEDLKKTDIWSLGMVMYTLVNPNVPGPYFVEFGESGIVTDAALQDLLKREVLPKHDLKYETVRSTQWKNMEEMFEQCCKFNPTDRPSATQLLRSFKEESKSQKDQNYAEGPSMTTPVEKAKSTKGHKYAEGILMTAPVDEANQKKNRQNAKGLLMTIPGPLDEAQSKKSGKYEGLLMITSGPVDKVKAKENIKEEEDLSTSSDEEKDSKENSKNTQEAQGRSVFEDLNEGDKTNGDGNNECIKEPVDKNNSDKEDDSQIDDIDDESSSDKGLRIDGVEPSTQPYKEDVMTPIFSWEKAAYTKAEIVSILLGSYKQEQLCLSPPINVSHNVSFLMDMKSFPHADDIKCDDMGVWEHKGSPKDYFRVQNNSSGTRKIVPVDKKSVTQATPEGIYTFRRTYYKNASDDTIRKTISKLYDCCDNQVPLTFVQYLFSGLEHKVKNLKPHGNAKFKSPYTRLLPSTREKMKNSVFKKERWRRKL